MYRGTMRIPQSRELSSITEVAPRSDALTTPNSGTKSIYQEALHVVSELLATTPSPKLSLKSATTADVQKLLKLQDEVQRHHLGVELVSRLSESMLSITRKIQNG